MPSNPELFLRRVCIILANKIPAFKVSTMARRSSTSAAQTKPEFSHNRASDRVASRLMDQIRRGHLKPGDLLPSCRQLALQMGVSINTAQAAMARLEGLGAIACQPRQRAVVRSLDDRLPNQRGLVLLFAEPGVQYTNFASSWNAQIMFAAENFLIGQHVTAAKIHVPWVNQQIPPEDRAKIEQMLTEARGVIWLASTALHPLITAARERGTPIVTINAPEPMADHNAILADNVNAGRMAGRAFVELGYHRCLLLLRGIEQARFTSELVQGFVESFVRANVPLRGIDYVHLPEGTAEAAQGLMTEYLRKNPRPQGIFTSRDNLAIGAMQALRSHGTAIPQDVGILSGLGFDICKQVSPTLSSLIQPTQDIGQHAARMLMHLLENPSDRLPVVRLPVSLILRQSLPNHERLRVRLAGTIVETA